MNPTRVTITTDEFEISVKLGDGPVTIQEGYGGWQTVERPENKPLTRWDGAGPLTIELPLLFDRRTEGRRIQSAVNSVMNLGRVGGGSDEPPTFVLTGAFQHSGKTFVMASTPETTNLLRRRDGSLDRVELRLTAMQYVRPDRIKFKKLPKKRRRVRAKQGDTINKIARRIFKGKGRKTIAKKAKQTSKINGIRDRNKKLKKGQKIKLP